MNDLVGDNLEKIIIYGKSLNIIIDSFDAYADGLLTGLNFEHNTRRYRLISDEKKYYLLHYSCGSNRKGKDIYHLEEESYYFETILTSVESSHNGLKRTMNRKNYYSIMLESKLKLVSNQRKDNKKDKKKSNKKYG